MNKQILLISILAIMALILYSGANIKYSDDKTQRNNNNNSSNNNNNNNNNKSNNVAVNKKRRMINNVYEQDRLMRKEDILKGILNNQLSHMRGKHYYDTCRYEAPY